MQLTRSLITPVLLAVLATTTYAQRETGGTADKSDNPEGGHVIQLVPAGQTARYVGTYMRSSTVTGFRNATVVSITNNSPVSCATTVEWFQGFSNTASCTTQVTLAAGFTGEHCSRSVPSVVCNATCNPEQTGIEGRVRIASTADANGQCANIAVESRVIYTTGGATDTGIAAISQSKVVRVGQGNQGN